MGASTSLSYQIAYAGGVARPDPKTLGAKCAECVLKKCKPVSSEIRMGKPAIVSEAPGTHEEKQGAPLVGPAGMVLADALKRVGSSRGDWSYIQRIACRPPGNDLKTLLAKLRVVNRGRIKAGEKPLPSPLECCAPRFYAELAHAPAMLLLGSTAYKSVVPGARGGIEDARGALRPIEPAMWKAYAAMHVDAAPLTGASKARKVTATLSPAHVAKFPRWKPAFYGDVKRAIGWFKGAIEITTPTVYLNPSPAQIGAFLRRDVPFWPWDVETSLPFREGRKGENSRLIRPLEVKLYCIGIGDPVKREALVVPVHSIDLKGAPAWDPLTMEALCRRLAKWATDPTPKAGWNSRWFDRLVFEQWTETVLGERVTPDPHIDLITAHRLLEPEMRHSLAYAASTRTNTTAWKEAHTAIVAKSDQEMGEYNGIDVVNTGDIAPGLISEIRVEQMTEVFKVDTKMVDVCAGMHRIGIRVDQAERQKWDIDLSKLIEESRQTVWERMHEGGVDPMGWDKKGGAFNPSSPDQIRALLFGGKGWALPPPIDVAKDKLFTESGERSTAGLVLRAYMADPMTPKEVIPILEGVRRFKKWTKLRGTYVTGMRYAPDQDSCWLSSDGRVHAGWAAHGTAIGRVSCSKPNLVNVPGKPPANLRTMLVPEPGHVFVGADFSALHLIIIACLWEIPSLLEAFTEGKDPHALAAGVFFGDAFWKAPGQVAKLGYPASKENGEYKGNAKNMRATSKTIRYASAYGADSAAVVGAVRKTENDKGDLVYLDFPANRVEALLERMHAAEPQWKRGWGREVAMWKAQGYLADPILGRRFYGRDGEDFNKLVNARVFMCETAIANVVTTELYDKYPAECFGKNTGMVHHNYDSIVFEVPEAKAKQVAADLHDGMNRHWPKLGPIPTTAEVAIGYSLADV